MCGIIGYISTKPNAINTILKGLDDLSHRGYDSMGLAYLANAGIRVVKKGSDGEGNVCAKDVEQLIEKPDTESFVGIGHTRWATFGEPSDNNAHPHKSQDERIHLVHNGNMDNYSEIRELLENENIIITTDTDSELIANLLSLNFEGDMASAIKKTMNQVEGAHAILVMLSSEPEKLYAFTKGGCAINRKNK